MLSPTLVPHVQTRQCLIEPNPLVKPLADWLEVDTAEVLYGRGATKLAMVFCLVRMTSILQTPVMNLMVRHIQKPTKDRNGEQILTLEQCLSM